MVEEVKKLKMKIVDFNKKQMKERIEKIKVETEKRISEGMVQNRPIWRSIRTWSRTRTEVSMNF